MTLILNVPELLKLGEERFPKELMVMFQSHRAIALVSLVVGGLWSLQNMWYY